MDSLKPEEGMDPQAPIPWRSGGPDPRNHDPTKNLIAGVLYGSDPHENFTEINVILECGPMPNLTVALPNIGGALCSTP